MRLLLLRTDSGRLSVFGRWLSRCPGMAMRRVMPLRSRAYSDFRPGWIIIPAKHDDNKAHWPGGVMQQLVYVHHHCQHNLGNTRGFASKLLLLRRSEKKFPTAPKH